VREKLNQLRQANIPRAHDDGGCDITRVCQQHTVAPFAIVLVVDATIETQIHCVSAARLQADDFLLIKDSAYQLGAASLVGNPLLFADLPEPFSEWLGNW
jgi:hypothetical protein